jgi:hypothetical protein
VTTTTGQLDLLSKTKIERVQQITAHLSRRTSLLTPEERLLLVEVAVVEVDDRGRRSW